MKGNLVTDNVLPEELKLLKLLDNADLIGGIYNMGYDTCLILTNDLWKKNAGGVPQHCFLLATVMAPKKAPIDPDDEEIILLRVIGPAKLPTENDLISVRSDAMRAIITDSGKSAAADQSRILDVLTRNEIQFSGIEAKILGTFYEDTKNNAHILRFGSDLDNFYSSSRYKVYKPHGDSLSTIVSFLEGIDEQDSQQKIVQIGYIRYSSTKRRSYGTLEEKSIAIPVKINIEDLISMKTAIFGMTRLGKSNTMKIIATAVFEYALEKHKKIGQLLFDPTGEYANVNIQDQTALSQIGSDYVSIFKYGETSKPNEKPLRLNFYDPQIIEAVWAIIKTHVLSESSAGYFKNFAEVDVIGPEAPGADYDAHYRAERRRSALYATLMKAGFQPPKNFQNHIVANATVVELVNASLDESQHFTSEKKGKISLTSANIELWWKTIDEINTANPEALVSSSDKKPWVDTELDAILKVFNKSKGYRGYTILAQLRAFHSPASIKDFLEEIQEELLQGKIIIIDLSLGNENVLQYVSERIINGILQYSSRLFRQGNELPNIQIFIEEAHRLFHRTKFEKPESADPYVRLAKEAAKFKIGLIYATQEVTSVDPQVLANTSNWIVTHLNNHKEVSELSKYYDFKDFYDQIIKSEDVGFARIKTKSGRYIIPIQIDLFSKDRIDHAQKLAAKLKAK